MKTNLKPRMGRHMMLWGMLIAMASGVSWRLADLSVVNESYLQTQGDLRSVRTIALNSYRGMILDRNGEPLAISTPVESVWVQPKEMQLDAPEWKELCRLLDLNTLKTKQSLASKSNKDFVYLKRQIPPYLAEKVMHLKLAGVYLQQEYRRYYPMGEVAAHVVGATNIDQQGIEGLELSFNDDLSGKSGEKTVIKDRLGRQIQGLDKPKESIPGKDIQLSVDARLQYLAYKELLNAVNQNKAKSGSIVVLDAETFEVLAMANVPSYNPNLIEKPLDGSLRNRAVTDQMEPGSVIKPLSLIPVLASGQYFPDTPVNTSPGWIRVNHKVVRDVVNFGQLDVGRVIEKSSNVGITKLVLSLPPKALYNTLSDLGFGERTSSGFPGEVAGQIQPGGLTNPFALATLAFGYGISATPLQIADAYATIASLGVKRPISFLKGSDTEPGQRIYPNSIAQAITKMLVNATSRTGTAYRASVPGYLVAGKTGTARKVGKEGYDKDSHLALFAGFAPAYNPKVVMAVVINEPQGDKYYGGQIAAPVFSKVMQGALRLMRVAPFGDVNLELTLVKN